MGADTKIQWCDFTFNPWEGCTKVSPGCAHCYAEARNKRFGGGTAPNWGKGAPRRRTSVQNWNQVRKWDREAGVNALCAQHIIADGAASAQGVAWAKSYRSPRVFVASLADWLDEEVSVEWLADLLALVRDCPQLDFLMLTKRPQNWKPRLTAALSHVTSSAEQSTKNYAFSLWLKSWLNGEAPANVWIGATAEDQWNADNRVPELLNIPARIRFLSCEPMLSQIDLAYTCFNLTDSFGKMPGIHWVICGGESGHGAREFIVDHADDLRRQCERAGVAFFMKQLGEKPICSNVNALDWPEETNFFDDITDRFWVAGARIGLKDKKGGDMAEFPEELQVRQFPEFRT